MTETKKPSTDSITDEQLLRAARSFEAIMFSQIEIQEKLSNDLKHAIRFGMIILGLIAISILILLLTLSSQINRISDVVLDMNQNFTTVTLQMDQMSGSIDSMVTRVALLEQMDSQTGAMKQEMTAMTDQLDTMRGTVNSMGSHVTNVRQSVENMANTINRMDDEVQMMATDMRYMAKPARSINKLFPIP